MLVQNLGAKAAPSLAIRLGSNAGSPGIQTASLQVMRLTFGARGNQA